MVNRKTAKKMSGFKPNINLGQGAEIVDELIPDTEPTTRVGRWLRWVKRVAKAIETFTVVKQVKDILK